MDVDPALDIVVVEQLRAWYGLRRAEQLTALFRSFNSEAQAMIAAMESDARRNDRAGVARMVHKLLGSSATIGARSLTERCAHFDAGRGSGPEDVLTDISVLAAEQRRFSTELEQFLGGHDEPSYPNRAGA